MTALREEFHGIDRVIPHGVGDEVVEVDPRPSGFDAFASDRDFVAVGAGMMGVDRHQPVPVRAGEEQPPRAWIPNRSLTGRRRN
ncbi:MAG: hypothetical protein WBN99_09720 [Mycobacterium sp.]